MTEKEKSRMATLNPTKMELKIHKRGQNDLKKVLVYGLDKSGKSTFVEHYCKENNLNGIVIDIDDTNYTDMDYVLVDTTSPAGTLKNLINTINAICDLEYDTIVLDGVTSLLEHLTGVGKGMNVYSERSRSWNMVLRKMKNSKKNIIFVGQIDMAVSENEDQQPSKAIIHVNSLVNEKYHTYAFKKGKTIPNDLVKLGENKATKMEYFVDIEAKRTKE